MTESPANIGGKGWQGRVSFHVTCSGTIKTRETSAAIKALEAELSDAQDALDKVSQNPGQDWSEAYTSVSDIDTRLRSYGR